jgi:hypothetical protein
MPNNNNEKSLEKLEEQLQLLCKNRIENQDAINDIERKLTALFCPKGKSECEPAYCIFRRTDSCDFLNRWRVIIKKYSVT